jgi:queuosine precursor transporter
MPHSYRFIVIIALFITCLITANILIVKQFSIGSLLFPAGIIIFPINYILSDVLTEVYGYSQARQVIWLGFICNLLVVIAFWIGQILPPAPVFEAQSSYERILGSTPRFLAASFLAYLVGEFANSFILSKMKIATRGRWLWSRTIGSTIAGQGIDSFIVLTLSFAGVLPWEILGVMIISHWLLKTAYETVATPITYLVVNYLKKKENSDVYDYKTDFNPIHFN